MKVILFTGLSGSGKSVIAEGVGHALGIPVINLHSIVHNIAVEKGYSRTREWAYNEGLGKVLSESRQTLVTSVSKVENDKAVIIDEILDPETLELLKESHPNSGFITIYIRANRHDRRRFILKRSAGDDPNKLVREMREIDYLKEKAGIRKIIEGSDIVIENFSHIEEVTERLTKRLSQEINGEIGINKEKEI